MLASLSNAMTVCHSVFSCFCPLARSFHVSVVAMRRRAMGTPPVVARISGSAPRCPMRMTLFTDPAMEMSSDRPGSYNPSGLSDRRHLVRSAWGITAWTAVSRVAGVLRDATIARFLGASASSDAFYTAFRIPNTFRAIVGEGGLPGAFVPIAKRVERESPGSEGVYAGRVLALLSLVLAGLVGLGLLFAPALVDLFARGYHKTPGKFEL